MVTNLILVLPGGVAHDLLTAGGPGGVTYAGVVGAAVDGGGRCDQVVFENQGSFGEMLWIQALRKKDASQCARGASIYVGLAVTGWSGGLLPAVWANAVEMLKTAV